MRSPLDGVGAQVGVEAGALGRGAEEREQCLRDGEEEEESVAPGSAPDVGRPQAETEAQILLVETIIEKRGGSIAPSAIVSG